MILGVPICFYTLKDVVIALLPRNMLPQLVPRLQKHFVCPFRHFLFFSIIIPENLSLTLSSFFLSFFIQSFEIILFFFFLTFKACNFSSFCGCLQGQCSATNSYLSGQSVSSVFWTDTFGIAGNTVTGRARIGNNIHK